MAKPDTSAFRFWLLVSLALIVTFLLVVKETWLEEGLAEERQGIYELLGAAKAEAAEARAYRRFDAWFIETSLVEKSYQLLVPPPQSEGSISELDEKIDPAFVWIEGRIRAFWLVVFQVMYRISISMTWWPFIVLTLIPFSIDAFVRRQIMSNTFDHTSPTLQALGVRAMAIALISLPFLLIAPFALPAQLMPVLIFLFAAACWFAVSHFVKRA